MVVSPPQRCSGQKDICTGDHLASLMIAEPIHSLPCANTFNERSDSSISKKSFLSIVISPYSNQPSHWQYTISRRRLQLRIASFPDCFFDTEKICDRQYKHGNNAEKSHFKRFGKGTGGNSAQPEAQVDRFMLKVVVSYPKKEEEKLIIRMHNAASFPKASTILKPEDIVRAREVVKDVYMDEKIEKYIVDIVYATRTPEEYGLGKLKDLISYGASPRASISLAMASKAYAFIKRRGYVIPEDVRAVCYEVLRHRIGLTYEAEAENITTENIITDIINTVEVP